jgi:purine-binding chemotaxis protein CheW
VSNPNTPPPTPRTTDIDPLLFSDEEDGRDRVLLVEVRGNVYAMQVAQVREVLRARSVTRVPGAPPVVHGLVNVRGMVVTVLDLAACLGASGHDATATRPDSAGEGSPRADSPGSIVLLEHGGRLAGLAVEAVRDVRTLDDVAVVSGTVATGHASVADGVVQGLASAGGDVVILLDVLALLARHLISSEEMGR